MKMIKNRLFIAFLTFGFGSSIQSMEPEKTFTFFAELPLEIQLMSAISAAQSLEEATDRISALAVANKELNELINDPTICFKTIKDLAKQFSCSDQEAAEALRTQEAKNRLAIQNQFFNVCNQEDFNEKDFKTLYDKYGTYVDLYFTYNIIDAQEKKIAENFLMLAAAKGDCSLIQTLFKYRVNVNIGNKSGLTALMIAARNRNIEVVQCLLNNTGIIVNQRAIGGLNALIYAVIFPIVAEDKNCPIIQMLLKYGADINQADDDGMTPLLAAVEMGNVDVVTCLLGCRDIEINKQDNKKRTALQLAKEIAEETGNQEIVNLIMRAIG